jgi:hypothetical protein
VDPKKYGAIELYECGREAREKRVRDASNKLKIKIAESNAEARTGTTGTSSLLTPAKARSRNLPDFNKRQNRSFDVGMLRPALLESRAELPAKEEVYKPKIIIHSPEVKNVLLKPRNEEYNENIYDSLLESTKTELTSVVKKYINSKESDQERAQTFAKILVNGLYSSKFISRKECMYTPKKVLLPKTDVSSRNLGKKRSNSVHRATLYSCPRESKLRSRGS